MSARGVIALAAASKADRAQDIEDAEAADDILAALDAAGFAIVPKVATDEMMRAYYSCMEGTHPTARMNPDKYLTHNLKAGKRWAAMLKAAKEAVPADTACQSSEQAAPETTPNDEQPT